jgi:hypothetical protein
MPPLTNFTVEFDNTSGCLCGKTIDVLAQCRNPDSPTDKFTLTIECPPDCPIVDLRILSIAEKCDDNGRRTVELQPVISTPAMRSTAIEIDFGDGSPVGNAIAVLPGRAIQPVYHSYAPGTYPASLNVPLPSGCLGKTIKVDVPECGVVTSCCPTLTLSPPDISGCGSSAGAQYAVTISWPEQCSPITPTGFAWTVEITRRDPTTGNDVTRKFQRQTTLPSARSSDAWSEMQTGATGPLMFEAYDRGSISVRAIIPGIELPCDPTTTRSFGIQSCCASLTGGINVTADANSPCTFSFALVVENPLREPFTIEWEFPDGTSANSIGTTASQIETVSVPHVFPANALTSGDVTANLIPDPKTKCPTIEIKTHIDADCRVPPEVVTPPPPPMGIPCWIMLIGALTLLLAGSITLVLAACVHIAPVALGVATAALWILGLALLAAWVLVCGKDHCDIVSTLAQSLLVIAGLAGVFTVGVTFAKFLILEKDALKVIDCLFTNGIANTTVLAIATGIVHFIGQAVGCIIYKK